MIDGIILPEQTEKLIQEMIPFYGEDKQEVIRTIIAQSIVIRCPCSCDANNCTGIPNPICPYCNGDGKIQYGIDELEFL